MTTQQLIDEITSRDTHKVWRSACEIISLGQNPARIHPLIEALPTIKEQTKNLDMGGLFAPNQRFVDFAIRTIEFHRDSHECPCALYEEHGVDPNQEEEKGYVTINDTTYIDGKWVDYYDVACVRCGHLFKVIERESHYVWWQWVNLSKP